MTKLSRALACLLCVVPLACSKSDAGSNASLAAGAGAPAAAAGSGGSLAPAGGGASGASGAGAGAGGRAGAQGRAGVGAGAGGSSGASGAAGGQSGAGAPAMMPPAAGAAAGGGAGAPAAASDEDIWVSPTGADSNPGTQAMPLAGLAPAVQRIQPGATIWIAAGTYELSQTVPLSRSGEESKPLRIFAESGERPVFDFMGQARGSSSARGLAISGDYWHIRGIDVINAGDNCINISGAHNTIERVVTRGCSDTGIQISANSSQAGDPTRAAHNSVINCDSYENYDQANAGENADGFVHAVTTIARQFDPDFDAATIELRDSKTGKYLGVTVTVTATSREQLDDLYRALSSHPMVKVVL